MARQRATYPVCEIKPMSLQSSDSFSQHLNVGDAFGLRLSILLGHPDSNRGYRDQMRLAL